MKYLFVYSPEPRDDAFCLGLNFNIILKLGFFNDFWLGFPLPLIFVF